MKLFLLPEDLKNDLLAYLMEQPYKLVATGVARLQAVVEAPPPPADEPKKKKE